MSSKISVQTEIFEEPKRRPYAARVDFLLGDKENHKFYYYGPVCLLLANDVVVELHHLSPEESKGSLQHLQRYRAIVQGFATASEAETHGLRLAMALLWGAISGKFPLLLNYHTQLPCVVYDRTALGSSSSIRSRSWTHLSADYFAGLMQEVFTDRMPIDRQLLLSMELFAAARLEVTERTRFICLISALEPLATQIDAPTDVKEMVEKFLDHLYKTEISELSLEDSEKLKNSLRGRIRELKRDSIRQALLRTVRELLSKDEDVESTIKTIDSAYALRSRILHEGGNDPYLDRISQNIEDIIRRMYAVRIGHALRIPSS